MIHLFHGFLGSPDDFDFLKRDDIISHDIYAMEEFPRIGPADTIIGYSLGGRIALDIAAAHNFQLKKIVLINCHPGLASEKERSQRKDFEVTILQKLKNTSMPEFMDYWNKLPIFLFDAPISLKDEKRFKKSAEIFDRYRLSNQTNHLPKILQDQEKFLWIIGSLDEKYMDLARDLLLPNNFRVSYIQGGHRLFQHPEALTKILQDEHIL